MDKKNKIEEFFPIPTWMKPIERYWIGWLDERRKSKAGFPSLFSQEIWLKRLEKWSNKDLRYAQTVLENSISAPWEKLYELPDHCSTQRGPISIPNDLDSVP